MISPLFEAARREARARLRIAPKGQRRKARKAYEAATAAALQAGPRK